jgi:putative ABC transport system permease protein
VISLAFLISGAAAVLGIAGAVLRAMKLPPAEAMRPEPPGMYRPTILERIGMQRFFSPPARMILRQLERRPMRAVLSCLGIAFSGALLVLGNFIGDSVNYVIDFQFYTAQRQDMTLTLVEPRSQAALYDIMHFPGVIRAEPFRSVSVRLRFGHFSRRTAIMGLSPHRELYRLLDIDEKLVSIPEEGLVLSEKLAEILGASIGDILTVEVMEGERPVRQIAVTGLISDFSGTSAYMDIRALNRMMHEGRTISGAFVTADQNQLGVIYRKLKEAPVVGGITLKKAALLSFQETLAKNLLVTRVFYVIFATIIAFGVVYNSVHVTLSERSRELATLRVIGFTRREVSFMLLGEVAALTLVAIPLGLLFGYWLAALMMYALQTESQRFPLIIEYSTYAFAAIVVVAATIASSLGARRKLDRLDLVSVLKSRD